MKILILITGTEYRFDSNNYITIESFLPNGEDEKKMVIDQLHGIIDYVEANF